MLSSFFSKGVSSLKGESSSFSASGPSLVPSVFSLMSPREFLLDSVKVVDDRMFPYELDREGAGVCGGDTRAESIFKEFIVLCEPSRKSCDDLCRLRWEGLEGSAGQTKGRARFPLVRRPSMRTGYTILNIHRPSSNG